MARPNDNSYTLNKTTVVSQTPPKTSTDMGLTAADMGLKDITDPAEIERLNKLNWQTFEQPKNSSTKDTDIREVTDPEVLEKAGVAINPDTRVDILKPYLDTLDIVLIMGVTPGAGGQKLIIDTLQKVKELVILRDKFGLDFEIEFDGGVNKDTRPYLDGIDTVVSGSYVCGADNYQERIDEIR